MNDSVFREKLLLWYKKNARKLPWRRTRDPYKIWISEVMLQQTTVKAVIPYYQSWIKQFPDIHSVSRASSETVLKAWQGLGYYQRVRNIHKSARMICERYNGRIPADKEILRRLPGFGPYTTGAVLSMAFDQPEVIIDANIRRVLMRVLDITGYADSKHDPRILKVLKKILPLKASGCFNQALMELGAVICRSSCPLCLPCPVSRECRAYRKGTQEIIPQPKTKTLIRQHAVVALIKHRKKYFIQKRPSKGLLADLWEFPGGKIEPGETSRQALVREVREELKVEIEKARHMMNLTHYYTCYKVHLSVWLCSACPLPGEDRTHRWVRQKELSDYAMPSGSAKIVERIKVL